MKKEQRDLEIWSVRLGELLYEKYHRILKLSAVSRTAADRPSFMGEQTWEIKGLVKFDWMMFPTEPEMTSNDFLSIVPQVTILKANGPYWHEKKKKQSKNISGYAFFPLT